MKLKMGIVTLCVLSFSLVGFHKPNKENKRHCTNELKKIMSLNPENHMEVKKVYKLLTQVQWQKFHDEGEFYGSPVDIKDGYIHLSKPSQVTRVKEKYYANIRPLYIVEFQGKDWLKTLRWEAASNGDLYPHLYDEPLKFENVSMIEICR